jgi:hypothetical protein
MQMEVEKGHHSFLPRQSEFTENFAKEEERT